MIELLGQNPLWIVIIVLTVGLHVGFALAVRHWMRSAEKPPPES
jgi:uncharacterized protein YneF (UPF0154 family)